MAPVRHAWIISVGTELTLGQTVDTNSAWLAQRLAGLGIRTTRHLTLPDELTDIRDAARAAAAAADVVLISGGLGPTADDLTRAALAAAAGVDLEEHAPSVAQIRAFFAARGRALPEPNLVQARLPRGATAIANTCGTAPGLRVELDRVPVFAVPGVPFEMRAMFERDIEPWLRARAGGAVLLSRRLHCIGAGESDIGARIHDLMERGRNPEVGTTAQLGIIGIRINARGSTPDAAAALLDATERQVRARLGPLVFGRDDETLAGVVGAQLRAAGKTLAVAESCTGGMVSKLLTDVSGSSAYFRGGVVAYANATKCAAVGVAAELIAHHGAVSGPVAAALARGARERLGTDYGLGVTGIAGPAGGSPEKPIGLVYIGIADAAEVRTVEQRFGADAPRFVIRERAANAALNLLRLASRNEPGPPK